MAGTEENINGLSQEQMNDVESLHGELMTAGCAIKFEAFVTLVIKLAQLGFDEKVAESLCLSGDFISWDDLKGAQYELEDYLSIEGISFLQARELFEKVNPGMHVQRAPAKNIVEQKDRRVIVRVLVTA